MGVPHYSTLRPPTPLQQQQQSYFNEDDETYPVNYNYNNYEYNPSKLPSSSFPTQSSPDILSEYLSNGLSSSFINKYQKELTIVASSLSVLILIIIGTCLWCLIGLVKRGKDSGVISEEADISAGSTSSTVHTRKSGGNASNNELDSSLELSGGVIPTKSNGGNINKKSGAPSSSSTCRGDRGGGKWYGGGGKKGISLISKIFSKQNGNSARILAQHRNIITPDKTIPFVVPTIQLPAQPEYSRTHPHDTSRLFPHDFNHPHSSLSSPLSDTPPQPSTSSSSSKSASVKHQALLLAQQFFPQLEHPDSDSCPLVAFSLYYEQSSQILNVRLLEGRNFPDTLIHTVAVKIYPGRQSKQNTKEFKTRSPVYNQEFCFHVRKTSLLTKILKLRAVIPGSPKRVIGYVNVALKDLPGFDKTEGGDENGDLGAGAEEDLKTSQLWRRVELPSEGGDGVKLQMSLKWSPEPGPGLLTLKIIEASGLHENRDCDYTSSYVKVTLQEQGRNIKTRKTQLVRWGSVPVFDDVFVLTIPRELLTQISFLLVVIARGRLGSKAVLGKICVGPVPYALNASASVGSPSSGIISATGTSTATSSLSSAQTCNSSGIEFWEDMCHQPDSEIVRWLHLLP